VYCEKRAVVKEGRASPYHAKKAKQIARVRKVELNRLSSEAFQRKIQKRSNENIQ
jgi:hypothetical protein